MGNHIKGKQDGTGKRARYHHGDLRRDLLQVARREIAEHGAAGLSLAGLARIAGVSQPAPYRHFADRNALIEAVASEGFQELIGQLEAALNDLHPPQTPATALALAYVRFGEENIELYRLMFASGLTPAAAAGSLLATTADEAFGLLRDVLASSQAPGERRIEQAVYRAWAQLHGLVMLKADGFIISPLDTLLD